MSVLLAFLSLLVERFAGYPDAIFRAIGHPVVWMGALISFLDDRLNDPRTSAGSRKMAGVIAIIILVFVSGGFALLVQRMLGWSGIGLAFAAILASSLIAQKSLDEHVSTVAEALEKEGLAAGRHAVSMVVGRDPERLDEAGVSRAAIESLAENFSDGVVAPAFWLALSGLPGIVAYKAINTADSMIGHRTPRHEAFGWAAARLDDLVNLPASRLCAVLLVVAAFFIDGASPRGAWAAIGRDASRHRSPNAGWPEAAMAGALGLALAGPRRYGGVLVDDAMMGEGGRREADAADIRRALALYRAADWLLIAAMGVIAFGWLALA
jgi:adenosylcobinamide-phosphate synthase